MGLGTEASMPPARADKSSARHPEGPKGSRSEGAIATAQPLLTEYRQQVAEIDKKVPGRLQLEISTARDEAGTVTRELAVRTQELRREEDAYVQTQQAAQGRQQGLNIERDERIEQASATMREQLPVRVATSREEAEIIQQEAIGRLKKTVVEVRQKAEEIQAHAESQQELPADSTISQKDVLRAFYLVSSHPEAVDLAGLNVTGQKDLLGSLYSERYGRRLFEEHPHNVEGARFSQVSPLDQRYATVAALVALADAVTQEQGKDVVSQNDLLKAFYLVSSHPEAVDLAGLDIRTQRDLLDGLYRGSYRHRLSTEPIHYAEAKNFSQVSPLDSAYPAVKALLAIFPTLDERNQRVAHIQERHTTASTEVATTVNKAKQQRDEAAEMVHSLEEQHRIPASEVANVAKFASDIRTGYRDRYPTTILSAYPELDSAEIQQALYSLRQGYSSISPRDPAYTHLKVLGAIQPVVQQAGQEKEQAYKNYQESVGQALPPFSRLRALQLLRYAWRNPNLAAGLLTVHAPIGKSTRNMISAMKDELSKIHDTQIAAATYPSMYQFLLSLDRARGELQSRRLRERLVKRHRIERNKRERAFLEPETTPLEKGGHQVLTAESDLFIQGSSEKTIYTIDRFLKEGVKPTILGGLGGALAEAGAIFLLEGIHILQSIATGAVVPTFIGTITIGGLTISGAIIPIALGGVVGLAAKPALRKAKFLVDDFRNRNKTL